MIQRRIAVLLLTMLLAIPVVAVNAQTPDARGMPEENELTGLQATVWRTYAPADAFVGEGEIAVDDATPNVSAADATGLRSISVMVRAFDTADSAASAFEQISVAAETSIAPAFPDGTVGITSEDLPTVGTQAMLVRMDYSEDESEFWMEFVTVQRDEYVFFVSANGSILFSTPETDDFDKSLPAEAIATAIATDGEPSPDESNFVEDGTSTGGLWGFMIPANDPLLMGLVPFQDTILYPNPGT